MLPSGRIGSVQDHKMIAHRIALAISALTVSVMMGAETVRPSYGTPLQGLNRNVLERQKSALVRGEGELVRALRLLERSSRHGDGNLFMAFTMDAVCWYFTGDERHAVRAFALLEDPEMSFDAEDSDGVAWMLDAVTLLMDSGSWSEDAESKLKGLFSEISAKTGSPLVKALLLQFHGDTEKASALYLADDGGAVSPRVAYAAEKTGVDIRSRVAPEAAAKGVERSLEQLVCPDIPDTVLSDEDFLSCALNLDYPGLEKVKRFVYKGNYSKARKEYVRFVRDNKGNGHAVARDPSFDRSDADKAASNLILSVGVWHQFGPVIDWMANPTPDQYKEWTWHLNYHDWWPSLRAAYGATGDEKYARAFVSQMRSWVRQSPRPDFHGRVAYSRWRSIETGTRMMNYWPDAFKGFLNSPSFDDESVFVMIKSMYEHCLHLRAYYRTHNWLVREMRGLFTIGIMFPELKNSQEWCSFASSKMLEEQDSQFYPDGMQTELAPGYHVGAQRNMVALYNTGLEYGYSFPAGFTRGIEKSYDALLKLIMPDGTIPAHNDSWWTDGRIALAEGCQLFSSREDFRYLSTMGKEGCEPAFKSMLLPWSGWAAMRSGWDENALYLFFDCGPFGAGHQHEGKLSFIASAYGRKLITEGATYAYDSSENRKYIVSSRAHNVSRVDGKEQNRRSLEKASFVAKKPVDGRWISNECFDFYEGEYDEGFGETNDRSVSQYRAILFVKDRYWIVFDVLNPHDDKVHRSETWFHLNSETYSVLPSINAVQSQDSSRSNVVVAPFGDELDLDVICGQADPELQGWVSSAGTSGYKLDPVATPVFMQSFRGTVINPYLIYPLRPGEQSPIRSLAYGDGRLSVVFENGAEDDISIRQSDGRIIGLSFNGTTVF